MPNANYVRGRAAEYKLVKRFKDAGWRAYRTAGSHGPHDVIAVPPDAASMEHVQFIQVKCVTSSGDPRKDNVKIRGLHQAFKPTFAHHRSHPFIWERIMIYCRGKWY